MKKKNQNIISNEELEKERKKRSKKDFSDIIARISAVALFLLVITIYIVMFTPIFDVREVIINGNTRHSYEEILATSEIKLEENMFKQSMFSAERKIKKLLFVKSVDIKRKPRHTLEINIIENHSDVLISYNFDGFIGVTKDGIMLEKWPENPDGTVLYDTVLKEFKEGQKIPVDVFKKFDIINLLEGAREAAGIERTLLSIDPADKERIIIVFQGPFFVTLGTTDDLTYKFNFIKKVIDTMGGAPKGRLDVSRLSEGQDKVIYSAE